jgi:hypothetical protein
MSESPRDESEDPTRSIDQDLPESKQPPAPPHVGPAVAGPVVAASTPATGETFPEETPSEADVALEREVKETRVRPGR